MLNAYTYGTAMAVNDLQPRQEPSTLGTWPAHADMQSATTVYATGQSGCGGDAYGAWPQHEAFVGTGSAQLAYVPSAAQSSDGPASSAPAFPVQQDANTELARLLQDYPGSEHEYAAAVAQQGMPLLPGGHVAPYGQTPVQQFDAYPLNGMDQQPGASHLATQSIYTPYTPSPEHYQLTTGYPSTSPRIITEHYGTEDTPRIPHIYTNSVTLSAPSGVVMAAPAEADLLSASPRTPSLVLVGDIYPDQASQAFEDWPIHQPAPSLARQSSQQSSTSTTIHFENMSTEAEREVRPKRKRRRIERDRQTEVEAAGGGENISGERHGKDASAKSKMSIVCENCKKHKIRCNIEPGKDKCPRCLKRGLECTFEKRKVTTHPNKKENLLKQLKEKDAIIEMLLEELYSPFKSTPLSARALRERMTQSGANNPNVQEWLSRTEGASGSASTLLQVPEDDATSEGMDTGSARASSESAVGAGTDEEEGSVEERDSHIMEAFPLAQMAELRKSKNVQEEHTGAEEVTADVAMTQLGSDVGITNKDYFNAGPSTDVAQRKRMGQKHTQSNLVAYGIFGTDDVDKLFAFYHQNINAFVPLLDPVLHTPRETFARCPCLFTVVCAITSRYYPGKAAAYPVAMHFALNECANALMHGLKCIELAQAFVLLAVYAHPAKRAEEERSYLYGGLAMRIAIDLNVNIAPLTKSRGERAEREQLNRTRLWMICFQMDWQMAAHYGKPSSLSENKIVRSAHDFYQRSEYNLVADIHLCAYNQLLRHIAGFHTAVYSDPDSRTGLRKDTNFLQLIQEYDAQLSNLVHEWQIKFAEETRYDGDPVYTFRCELLPYVVAYTRLVMYSFAFQKAYERVMQASDRPFFTQCMETAKLVVRIMIEKLSPTGYMRFAPNGWFNFCCFSSAFLMKLLRPEFSNMLSRQDAQDILDLIQRLIKLMGSGNMAVDEQHTPKLWARFLEELISKHHKENAMTRQHENLPRETPGETRVQDVPTDPQPYLLSTMVQAPQPPTQFSAAGDTSYDAWTAHPDAFPVPTIDFSQFPQFQGSGAMWTGGYENTSLVEEVNPSSAMITMLNSWNSFVMPGHSWPITPEAGVEADPLTEVTF